MAQNIFQADDRFGNAYTIADVIHVTGTASTFRVDQSAVSVAHLPSNGQTALTPVTDYSLGAAVATTGLKTVTVASGTASGVYTLCVRHAGSAAGIGSFKAGI